MFIGKLGLVAHTKIRPITTTHSPPATIIHSPSSCPSLTHPTSPKIPPIHSSLTPFPSNYYPKKGEVI